MSQAYLAAAELLYRGRVSDREEQFAIIDSVTADEIQQLAAQYLKPELLRTAVVSPPGVDISAAVPSAVAAA